MLTRRASLFSLKHCWKSQLETWRVQLDGSAALVWGKMLYWPDSSSCASLKHNWLNWDCCRSSTRQSTHHLMAIFRRTIHHIAKLKAFKKTKVQRCHCTRTPFAVIRSNAFEMWGRFVVWTCSPKICRNCIQTSPNTWSSHLWLHSSKAALNFVLVKYLYKHGYWE